MKLPDLKPGQIWLTHTYDRLLDETRRYLVLIDTGPDDCRPHKNPWMRSATSLGDLHRYSMKEAKANMYYMFYKWTPARLWSTDLYRYQTHALRYDKLLETLVQDGWKPTQY